jgi:hypothetical protein
VSFGRLVKGGTVLAVVHFAVPHGLDQYDAGCEVCEASLLHCKPAKRPPPVAALERLATRNGAIGGVARRESGFWKKVVRGFGWRNRCLRPLAET